MHVKFEHMETERIILITILMISLVIIVTGAYRIVISILDGWTNSYLSHSKLKSNLSNDKKLSIP